MQTNHYNLQCKDQDPSLHSIYEHPHLHPKTLRSPHQSNATKETRKHHRDTRLLLHRYASTLVIQHLTSSKRAHLQIGLLFQRHTNELRSQHPPSSRRHRNQRTRLLHPFRSRTINNRPTSLPRRGFRPPRALHPPPLHENLPHGSAERSAILPHAPLPQSARLLPLPLPNATPTPFAPSDARLRLLRHAMQLRAAHALPQSDDAERV